jgi:aspartyl-tRNA(Asn)/glutamyl-tRNA(Gln) amidotransferase subunit C
LLGGINLKIEKEAEKILQEFSKALENIPELEETHYMVDNVNLSREDCAEDKNPDKIMRNAHVDEEGCLIAEKGKWVR